MTSSFEFTQKTEQTIQAAIQLAKDYANAQGISLFFIYLFCFYSVCGSCTRPHGLRSPE